MHLLIIGGTRFLGRAIVEAALADGHQLTLFNRGKSNPDLFPNVETITGDRDGGLDVLAGRKWDAVIDTCGYIPRHVHDSATLLADAVSHYTFISTISVYADPPTTGLTEESALATLEDDTVEEITGATYGGLKVLCEQAIDKAMGGRALHVRSGLIVGPHDPTERWTYWPVRVAEGGEMIAPGSPNDPAQFIDVRDLAEWTVRATAARLTGPYNATGPNNNAYTTGDQLAACLAASGADTTLTWLDEAFLLENEVAPWAHLPLWLPADHQGMSRTSCQKAIDAGLTFRDVELTARDTLAWNATRPADRNTDHDMSMSREREAELLKLWHARRAK